jgi:undecaprenyl-diphosphatase
MASKLGLLIEGIAKGDFAEMDTTLLTFFNQTLANSLLDVLMLGLTLSALGLFVCWSVTLLLGQNRRTGVAILAALASSLVLTLLFQFTVLRPRPEDVRLIWPTPNFPSYPSGHAAAALAMATVLALTYRGFWWPGTTLTGAGLVALSRVYLGHHYPSDILAGSILGAAVGAACYGLIVEPASRQSRWRWLLWPQIALAAVITHMAYLDLVPTYVFIWPWTDKVMHFALFGAVVFWLNIWWGGRIIRWGRWVIPLAILIPLAIATTEEGLQAFSPIRSADIGDLTSDLAGMVVFWWLSQKINRQIFVKEQAL